MLLFSFVPTYLILHILWFSKSNLKKNDLSKSKRKWLYRKSNPPPTQNFFYFLTKWNFLLISIFYLYFPFLKLLHIFQNQCTLMLPKLFCNLKSILFSTIIFLYQILNIFRINISFILNYHPTFQILLYTFIVMYVYLYFLVKYINGLQFSCYKYEDKLTKEMVFAIRAKVFEVVYDVRRETSEIKLSELLHEVSFLFFDTLDQKQINEVFYSYLKEQEGRLFLTSHKSVLIGPRSMEHEPSQTYISPAEPMNLFVKCDDGKNQTKTLQLFPFETIADLFFLCCDEKYISSDDNIMFRGKSLLDPKCHHLSLIEMGLSEGSHLWVRSNRLKAGVRRPKRTHEEMSGDVLSTTSRFPKRIRKQVEFYQPGDNNLSENIEPPIPSYTFPITFHQNRSTDAESFSYLNETEFYEFQCLLYWDIVYKFESLNKLRSPSATHMTFLKKKVLTLQQVRDLKNDWMAEKIHHTLYFCDMRAYSEVPISNLFDFASTFVLLMRQYSELNVYEFFDQIWSDFDSKNNIYSSHKCLGLDFKGLNLNFIVQSVFSIQKCIKAMNERLGSTKEHARFVSSVLSSMMLDNPAAAGLTDAQMAHLMNTTRHFISRARETVNEFQNQTVDNFDRDYADREYFTQESKKLMLDWWLKETIPAGGTITVQKRTKKGETPKPIPVRYLPCTVSEFYQRFKAHEEFGQRIKRKSDNKFVLPSFSTFRRYRPFHVKFLGKYRTGFCSTCMQFDEYLKTFRKLVDDNCICKSTRCINFTHKEGCSHFLEKFCDNGYCEECYCDPCQNCNSTSISKSQRFKPFMDMTTCTKYFNMENSARNFPNLKCMHRECTHCDFEFDEEFWKKFCNSSCFTAMDQNKMVETKVWAKKKVSTESDKDDYEVDMLVNEEMTTAEFLEKFDEFLNKKYGFIWHYTTRHNQRIHYNKMIRNIQKGEYGDEAMMFVVDYAGDWKMRLGPKESSSQFFKTKKCRILGLIEFSWTQCTGADSNSSFVFTEPSVPKTASVSIKFLKQRISAYKQKNPNLRVIHIWSDGSCKEFLNRKMFSNFGEQLPEGMTVVWHFFCNMHGKNICDSEFSGLKSKLDRVVKERGEGFQEVEDVYNFCQENLNSTKWKRQDGGLKSRTFFYQKLPVTNFSTDCEPFEDVKLFRNVMWQKKKRIIKFYRRNTSCSCRKCCLFQNGEFDIEVCERKDLHGSWKEENIFIQPSNKKEICDFYLHQNTPWKKNPFDILKKKKKKKSKDDDPSENFEPSKNEDYGWIV